MMNNMMPTFYPVSHGEVKPGAVSGGTTILGMKFRDGVLLSADSRTTIGREVSSHFTDKINPLANKIYCCRAGDAANTEMLALQVQQDLLAAKYRGERITVHLAAAFLRNLMYQHGRKLNAGMIVAGWDEKSKGDIFHVGLGGMSINLPYCLDGSGSSYLMGLMNHKYRQNMFKEECIELAKTCIKRAINIDTCSGGVVRIAIITKDGVERQIHFNTPDNKPIYKNKKFWAEIHKLESVTSAEACGNQQDGEIVDEDKKKEEVKDKDKEDDELEKKGCPCCHLKKLFFKKVDDKKGENGGGDKIKLRKHQLHQNYRKSRNKKCFWNNIGNFSLKGTQ